ncbi:O-antigen ligase family protein [Aliifodinibius sp. S!AR15-10]|uniref:O-antigen ligase family protein n=1 Tax=Aliifodinibius sp. S!AR15-10 TaxID=2950437 RepID=UPI002856B6B9|nr:O-antigen ligase family protein [Aliifodinibius sp. S!AR15-10]MDR8391607.1 O-antigen ligase family protein [Aliifodinibius sp. S!AR15-10]
MLKTQIKFRNIPLYLIGAFVFLALFIPIAGIGMYDSKRIFELCLFVGLSILFLCLTFQLKNEKEDLYISHLCATSLCVFTSFGIISAYLSKFPRYGFIEAFLFSIVILTIILISKRDVFGHYRLGVFVQSLAVIFSTVYLIYFFGNYIAAHLNPLVPMWPDRLSVSLHIGDNVYNGKEVLNFVHKRFFNHIQTWTLPLLISLALFFKTKKIYRNLLFILIACWWSLVFASGARGTLVALIISGFFLFILFRKKSYRFLGIAVCTAIAGFVIYYLLFQIFVPSKSLPVARMTDSGRLGMWVRALEMWFASPLMGAGPMHYAVLQEVPYFAHPHNFYLQLLSEWGGVAFLGFLALLILYVVFIKKRFLNSNFVFNNLTYRNSTVYMGFFGSAMAGFLHAGVSGVFHTPVSQIWAIIIISWLISLWNRKNDNSKIISVKRKHLSVVYLCLIIGLCILVKPDIPRLDKTHELYRKQFDKPKVHPRFWEQGLIYEDAVNVDN